jgi:hypothetical protein
MHDLQVVTFETVYHCFRGARGADRAVKFPARYEAGRIQTTRSRKSSRVRTRRTEY